MRTTSLCRVQLNTVPAAAASTSQIDAQLSYVQCTAMMWSCPNHSDSSPHSVLPSCSDIPQISAALSIPQPSPLYMSYSCHVAHPTAQPSA